MIFSIKPCPWCKRTPKFFMYYSDETWKPHFKCISEICAIKAESYYVPIRKSQKKDQAVIERKIKQAISNWNDNNPMIAYEGIELDFEEIAKEGNKRIY